MKWRTLILVTGLIFLLICSITLFVVKFTGRTEIAPYNIEMIEFSKEKPVYGMMIIPEGAEFKVFDSDEHWTHVEYGKYDGYVLNLNMP